MGYVYLHPEEESPGGSVELEHVDPSRGALRDSGIFAIARKEDVVVLDVSGVAISPAEVQQRVVSLEEIEQASSSVGRHQSVSQREAPRAELHQVFGGPAPAAPHEQSP